MVLLRVGFTMPPVSLPERCALTLIPRLRAAPFHPYLVPNLQRQAGTRRYIFCGTFRAGGVRSSTWDIHPQPSPLASTLPCGVRTFLSPAPAWPPKRPLRRGSDHPACSRKFHDSLLCEAGQSVRLERRSQESAFRSQKSGVRSQNRQSGKGSRQRPRRSG